MKRFFLFFVIFFLTAFPSHSSEQEGLAFIKGVSEKIMQDVSRSEESLSQKQETFREIFLDIIDLKKSIPFTLGRYARTASQEQMQSYSKALINNIVYTWTGRFCAYKDAELLFEEQKQNQTKDIFVTSYLQFPQSPDKVEVVWRLRSHKESFKLSDIIVEGISMLMSYRGEYTSFLQQNGGDISALIKSLEEKNAALKKAPISKDF